MFSTDRFPPDHVETVKSFQTRQRAVEVENEIAADAI